MLRKLVRRASACAVALIASVSLTHAAPPTTVQTDRGAVRGVVRHDALEFRGIPYAQPPVGKLRFALPVAAKPWAGVRDATDFGPACAQTRRYDLTERSEHEDCLTINVSVPADLAPGERLPVLFWIHGGAYVGGSANLYRLDRLAARGRLVVVAANYRVGVFGFLPIKGLPRAYNGDAGLEDQRLALRWVQRNIARFGGDPRNVTVAGESAGGGSVCMHLASPKAVAGLFHKALVQSAGCIAPMPELDAALSEADAANPPMWKRIAKEVGCGDARDALACLRQAPVASLLAAQDKHSTGVMTLSPTVGNGTVPSPVKDAAAKGALMRVPVLMGGTRDELRLYVAYDKLFAPFVGDYSETKLRSFWLPAFYGKDVPNPARPGTGKHDAIIAEYAAANGMNGASVGSMLSDYQTAVGISNCLYQRTAAAFLPWMPSLHMLEFADPDAPVLGVGLAKGMDPGFTLGAVHSSELNYWFPNYSNTSAIDAPDLAPASQRLADQMVDFVAAFARTGTPVIPGGARWPAYTGDGTSVMLLVPGAVVPYDAGAYHRCAFWSSLYP